MGQNGPKVSQELAKMSQERARMSQNLPGLLWMVPAVEGVSGRGFGLVFVVSATSKGEVMLSQAWYKMIIKRERKLNSGKLGKNPPSEACLVDGYALRAKEPNKDRTPMYLSKNSSVIWPKQPSPPAPLPRTGEGSESATSASAALALRSPAYRRGE